MELSQQRSVQPYGLLYPLMLIAAIAVIVFSILGIATIAGWMPNAFSAANAAPRYVATESLGAAASAAVGVGGRAFDCGECGMLEVIRAMEQGGAVSGSRVAKEATSRL